MRYVLLLSLVLTTMTVANAERRTPALPSAVRASLDQHYPGWKFPTVSPLVTDLFVSWESRPTTAGLPHLIEGDFDRDGKRDYAVLIVHGNVFNAAGVPFERREKLIVFLRRGRGYQSRLLSSEGFNSEVYLGQQHRGDVVYDLATDRTFVCEKDAIIFCYFEKGATLHVYRRGKFRQIIVGD